VIRFRAAVEKRDFDAIPDLLAEQVVFRSPIVYAPYTGKQTVTAILLAAGRVFEDFRYVREIGDPEGADHALVFEARIGDRVVTGCDFIHTDAEGLIDDFMVMVRPLSGAHALAAAMRAELEAAGSST
jgi:hypothetical protein